MNHRERVLAAVEHEEPNRVPVDLGGTVAGIHKGSYEGLKRYLGFKSETVLCDMMQRRSGAYIQSIDESNHVHEIGVGLTAKESGEMSGYPIKIYPTVGCCSLDCGLCPRYYTVGTSRCPGCCGPDFHNKHPSCSYITCCVKKKSLEVCAQCEEFPCSKFESWLVGGGEYDSFLSHKKAYPNLISIRKHGIEKLIEEQRKRIGLIEIMLKEFDDGKSKSFYYIASALLPIVDLETSLNKAKEK